MPTSPSRIEPVHNSGFAYEQLDEGRLRTELDQLIQREGELVEAQQGRGKSSAVQAFLFGFGNGDGVEANELGVVRGNINAVVKVMTDKGMEVPVVPEFNKKPKKTSRSMGGVTR